MATPTSITAGDYTNVAYPSYVQRGNFSIDTSKNYKFNGVKVKPTEASTVKVSVDGDVYTILMNFLFSDGTTLVYVYEGKIGGTSGGNEEPVEPTPLTTPSNLKVTYNGTSATITWDAVEGVDYYGVTYGSTAKNPATNSVTLEGLSYNTDYIVNVVAYPSDTTLHTSSETASIIINIGEDPNAGSSDEPEVVNLTSVSYSFGSKDITFSSANDTITGNIAYTGSFPSGTFIVVEGEPNTGEIGNIKLNGNTVSPEGSVNASVNYLTGSIEFNVSIVINETTYSGTVAAKLQ